MAKRTHRLRVRPDHFKALESGEKTFEIRRDGRGFVAGDEVTLLEIDPASNQGGAMHPALSGRELTRTITYVSESGGYGLDKNYCAIALSGAGK